MTETATQTQMEHAPGSFCWIELATTDGPAAKKFYAEVFGWEGLDNPMGGRGLHHAEAERQRRRRALSKGRTDEAGADALGFVHQRDERR